MMKQLPREAMRHGPLTGLTPVIWEGLLALAKPVTVEARGMLFMTGDPGQGCYVVQSGALKATMVSLSGREHMFAIFGPGAIVGEMSLFDLERRSATVEAIRKSMLLYISADVFFSYADHNPQLYRLVLAVMARRLRGTNEDVMAQGSSNVTSRVARALLTLAESLGEPVDGKGTRIAEKVSQLDISAMAGVARENASRAINQWIRNGVLSRNEGFYHIHDRAVLASEIDV
jgi:CRP/FNR family cyclic AMP-dependent transcriptional regulator